MKNTLIFLFFFSYIINAQTTLFNKSIELNPDIQAESVGTVLVNKNGEIYAIGRTKNRYESSEDSLFVVQLDTYGNVNWVKTYDFNNEIWEFPKESVLLNDGSLVIGGTVQYQADLNANAFLLKLDSLGNIVWHQEYGDEYYQSIYDLKSTLDGGFIFGRRTDQPELNGAEDAWLVKTDSLGNLEWEQQFGDISNNSVIRILVNENDTFTIILDNSTSENSYVSISIINQDGSILESNYYDTEIPYVNYGAFWDKKESVITLGMRPVSTNLTNFSGYLSKIDSTMNIVWDLEINNGIDAQEWLYKGVQLADGSYMVCGSTYHNQNLEVEEASSWRGWLVKVSEEGELLWSKVFRHDEDNYFEYFEDIALHPDGSIVIVGFTGQAPEEGQLGLTRNNMWILKVDENGNDWLPLTIEVSSSDTLFCVGDTIDLSTQVYNGKWCAYSNGENCPYDGWWTGSGTAYLNDSLSSSPYFVPNEGGIYDLTYHIVDQAGDTASISTANLIVFNRTELTGLDNATLYVGDTLSIIPQIVDVNAPYTNYEWSGTGASYLNNLTDTTTFIAQDSGIYNLDFYYEFGSDCSDIESFEIVVIDTLTTSLSNLSISPIKAYPNPAKEQITFEYPKLPKETSLKIYDTWGRLIRETILPIASKQYTLILKEVEAGIYFYQIGTEGQRGKFVVLGD